MYLNRGFLLVLVVIFIFSPTIQEWVTNNHGQWYRPFLVWAAVIFIGYVSQIKNKKPTIDVF